MPCLFASVEHNEAQCQKQPGECELIKSNYHHCWLAGWQPLNNTQRCHFASKLLYADFARNFGNSNLQLQSQSQSQYKASKQTQANSLRSMKAQHIKQQQQQWPFKYLACLQTISMLCAAKMMASEHLIEPLPAVYLFRHNRLEPELAGSA